MNDLMAYVWLEMQVPVDSSAWMGSTVSLLCFAHSGMGLSRDCAP